MRDKIILLALLGSIYYGLKVAIKMVLVMVTFIIETINNLTRR